MPHSDPDYVKYSGHLGTYAINKHTFVFKYIFQCFKSYVDQYILVFKIFAIEIFYHFPTLYIYHV